MVGVRIVDTESPRQSKEFKDCLIIALLLGQKYTFLPELYEIFGQEKLLKFIDIFGGTTITVPSQDDFLMTIRDVRIYLDVSHRRQGNGIRKIAERYGLSKARTLKIYKDIKDKIDLVKNLPLDDLFTARSKNGTRPIETEEKPEKQEPEHGEGTAGCPE